MGEWSRRQGLKASPPAQSYFPTSPDWVFSLPLHAIVLCPHGNQVALGLGNWRPRAWEWMASGIGGLGKEVTVPTELTAPLCVQRELSGKGSPSPNPGTERFPAISGMEVAITHGPLGRSD